MASVLSVALVRKEVKYSCKYPSCKNSYYINNPPGSENKRFFRFPTDPAVRKIWKDICEISPSKNVNNFHLCIDHFTASDFSKNSIKGHLYKTAVPQLSNSHDQTRSSKFQPRCLFPDNLPQLQTVNTTPSSIATNVPVRDNSTALNSTQSSSKSYEFLLADHDYAAHLNPQGQSNCSVYSESSDETFVVDQSCVGNRNPPSTEPHPNNSTCSKTCTETSDPYSFIHEKENGFLKKLSLNKSELSPEQMSMYKIHRNVTSKLSRLKSLLKNQREEFKSLKNLYNDGRFQLIEEEVNEVTKQFIKSQFLIYQS